MKEAVIHSRLYVPPALLVGMLFLGTLATAGYGAGLDAAILNVFALREGISPDWLIKAASLVSWSGGGTQRYIIVGVFALLLGRWLGWKTGAGLVAVSLLSNITSNLMKAAFARPRPSLVPHLDPVDSFAFPSGHATNAMVVYLFVALLLPPEQRRRWMLPLMALALATGMSRMMLGVHYPSDVLGGWMLGGAFAIAGAAFVHRWNGAK